MTSNPLSMAYVAQISSGGYVNIDNPDPKQIHIEDIAHSLSRICRFGGHVRRDLATYTVAQHSILVSETVPPELAIVGLLHDAEEAYLGDMIRPVKQYLYEQAPAFKQLVRDWRLAIGEAFGLGAQLADVPHEVMVADERALATEKRDVLAPARWWTTSLEPHEGFRIGYLAPEFARGAFLARFDRLKGV